MKKIIAVFLCLILLVTMSSALAETWTCSNCGNQSEGSFCGWCGAPKPQNIICSGCGAEYSPSLEYSYCMECGTPLYTSRFACLQNGVFIHFGHYEQDNNISNGAEEIEWIVLDTNGETATLISRYGLETFSYHWENAEVTWEACSLRTWLNTTFLDEAFTSGEQSQLEEVTVTADRFSSRHGETDPGNDTKDRVYLLSVVESYPLSISRNSDDVRICIPTAYAKRRGLWIGESGGCSWWLRSPGQTNSKAAIVKENGYPDEKGSIVDNSDGIVVRPVITLRLPISN